MDLIEVERKRRLPHPEETEKTAARLAALGYRKNGSFTEVDIYYSRPDGDYLETMECLRVRRRDGFAEITYKPASTPATRHHGDITAKPETNVLLHGADQAPAADRMLAAIGMIPLARVEKTRTLYGHPDHDDTTISLDTITGLGSFIETEIITADTTQATTHLEQRERQLDLLAYPVVRLPYRDLALRHTPIPA